MNYLDVVQVSVRTPVEDALHALNCVAGFKIRCLLRAITRLGLRGHFCA